MQWECEAPNAKWKEELFADNGLTAGLDSQATSHMTGAREYLFDVERLERPIMCNTAGGQVWIEYEGKLRVQLSHALATFEKVLFNPHMDHTLISYDMIAKMAKIYCWTCRAHTS